MNVKGLVVQRRVAHIKPGDVISMDDRHHDTVLITRRDGDWIEVVVVGPTQLKNDSYMLYPSDYVFVEARPNV